MKCILQKSIFVLLAAATTVFAEDSTRIIPDSTAVVPPTVATRVQSYLLDHGWVTTTVDNYVVNGVATNKRCTISTKPILLTNISSIQVYGNAQAIEGVQNTLRLDPLSYVISGIVSAPVNVAARDNGVQVNWQIWCMATETV